MLDFNLPARTIVNRVIPKNAFETFTNAKQKKLFTDLILRITWSNKLSSATLNLEGKEITEIQIFKIELKSKIDIKILLDIIDKSIPYPIIFVVIFENEFYISTTVKHQNPLKIDSSVLDWNFKTNWSEIVFFKIFEFSLKQNIDFVYTDFCKQIAPVKTEDNSIEKLVVKNQATAKVERQIELLKSKIKNEKQFNVKVELNMELIVLKKQLESLF